MSRIHIQFSGSLHPDDARSVLGVLKQSIDRRPTECGAILRVRELGIDEPDEAMNDLDGFALPIEQILQAIE